ncbi:MAG: hypothetical protein QOJ91_1331 [Sphingomonadales bacterium]|jgi:uncharacterized protein (TIGR02284 family)|nr:hypothetical protein [Sphingomonadales bacterium]
MDSSHDISVLNSLIATTIDSANGFERSAENVKGGALEEMFSDFAEQRRNNVGLLQQRVRALGGEPQDDGSLKADLHRRFEDLRKAFGGGDSAVIEEVERGEDYIKSKYEAALKDERLAADTRSVIEQAYRSVRMGHDRASALKHAQDGDGGALAGQYQQALESDEDGLGAASAAGPSI